MAMLNFQRLYRWDVLSRSNHPVTQMILYLPITSNYIGCMSENYNLRRRQLKHVKAAKFGFDNNKMAGSGIISRLVLSIPNPPFGVLAMVMGSYLAMVMYHLLPC